jgi:DNA-directed RNA polymerase subunit K/omega
MEKQEFTKYEKARILGARSLQISMDAPLLLKLSEEELNGVNYDPLLIAESELDSGVLPISVNKPMPEKDESDLKTIKIDEDTRSDAEKIKAEAEMEKDIAEGGEMMELANPEDEKEEVATSQTSGDERAPTEENR